MKSFPVTFNYNGEDIHGFIELDDEAIKRLSNGFGIGFSRLIKENSITNINEVELLQCSIVANSDEMVRK